MVLNLTVSRSTIEFKPLPVDHPSVRRPNINKARTMLGLEPNVGVQEGLSMTN